MARSQEARNIAAQARLLARGVIVPTRGAEYRERVERGVREGLTAAQSYGKGHRSHQPNIADLIATGVRTTRPRTLSGGGMRRAGPAGSTISQSTDQGDIERSLARAASHGNDVIVSYDVMTDNGPRRITLDGTRTTAKSIGQTDGKPIGPITITEVPAGTGAGGIDPDDLDWDDLDSWYDLEYEEGYF